jgi:hypothetical protein
MESSNDIVTVENFLHLFDISKGYKKVTLYFDYITDFAKFFNAILPKELKEVIIISPKSRAKDMVLAISSVRPNAAVLSIILDREIDFFTLAYR